MPPNRNKPTIYIAADHGGFELKQKLVEYLRQNDFEVKDHGPYELNPQDDYPDFAIPMMEALTRDPDGMGVVLCRNGVGVSIVANKYKGIRAGLCFSQQHVVSARADDAIGVVAIPSDYVDEQTAIDILSAFISTEFSKAPRHVRRIKKIKELEVSFG